MALFTVQFEGQVFIQSQLNTLFLQEIMPKIYEIQSQNDLACDK